MIRNDFVGFSNEIFLLVWSARHAEHIRFESGRAWYMAKGAVLVVEDDTTAQIPDFLISLDTFKVLCDWVYRQPSDEEIVFRLTPKDVLVQCGGSALALPRADTETNLYGEIEEAVFRPLITNKYHIKLDQETWAHQLNSLGSIHDEDSPNIPVVQITIGSDGILLESANSPKNVRVRGAIKVETAIAHHKEWKNKFFLNPFLLNPIPTSEVEISFADNEAKKPSPLMLRYENGYTLVAIPMWA